MRTVFVSSTIKDLAKERTTVKSFLEGASNPERLRALLSEAPNFPIGPEDTYKSVYEICIQNDQTSDFFILLLHRNYGFPNQSVSGRVGSITHREYLEAMQRHIPVFAFAHLTLWQKYLWSKENPPRSDVDKQEILLLDFLAEIETSAQKKWIHHFQNTDELIQILQSTLLSYDGSDIVADVTYPDGDKVSAGERFNKIWRIKNTGMQIWRDRVLKEQNPGNGLIPEFNAIPVPTTFPGQEVDLSVWLMAPKYPVRIFRIGRCLKGMDAGVFPGRKVSDAR